MGIYYTIINVDKKEAVSPHDFKYGAKMAEWCYHYDKPVLALHNLLAGRWKGDRVYVFADDLGDVDDEYSDELNYARKVFGMRNVASSANKQCKRLQPDEVDTEDHGLRYIYNHELKEFIDLKHCPNDHEYIAPLPLLISIGHDAPGGGNFDFEDDEDMEDAVGSWCDSVQSIEIRKEPLELLHNRILKRAFDILFSLTVLILIYPFLYVIVGTLIKLSSPGPVLFRQKRTGLYGKDFTCFKFRTMRVNREADELQATKDDPRNTRIGSFLRRNNLDEFPQFWNVLKGDMAFVGPRPLLPQYLPLYSKEQARRHEVRPGITGWAQVNGRNAISWTKKFELDVWYVDHCSFWLDMKILFLTVKKVFVREGISQEGQATMEFFNGKN